jgi:hypothetical protein
MSNDNALSSQWLDVHWRRKSLKSRSGITDGSNYAFDLSIWGYYSYPRILQSNRMRSSPIPAGLLTRKHLSEWQRPTVIHTVNGPFSNKFNPTCRWETYFTSTKMKKRIYWKNSFECERVWTFLLINIEETINLKSIAKLTGILPKRRKQKSRSGWWFKLG